jgi:ribosomal protein S18 acetylase RimI-like enzyme
MPQDTTIVTLLQEHLAQVDRWASSQNATKALLKLPGTSLSPTSDMHGWAVLRDNEVLAIATVKLNKEHVGYLECMVKPSARRQGIGSQLVEHVLHQPTVETLIHLHAVVDQTNIAAQKTLDSQGFSRTGYAADGRIEFARHKLK